MITPSKLPMMSTKDKSWIFFISPSHSLFGFILFICFVISLIIRFVFITNPELIRSDEPYYSFWGQYFLISTPDHPAFIGYMIKPFIDLFGENRFAYTLPFYLMMLVLTAVGAIALFRISKSSMPSIFFVLTMTLIPYFAGISVIVSTETPLIFFAFLAIFTYFFAFFEKPQSTFIWLLGGFFLALALFSKLTAIFVIAGIFSYPILSKNRKQHLKNHRLYLSALPIIIMALIILIDDYYHDFWLVRYTLIRSDRPFSYINQWDKPLGMIFSQFNIFSPLLVILIPILLTRSFKNYFSKDEKQTSSTDKISLLSKEQSFFFVATSLLPIIYALYKVATTFLGSYWTSFAYPSMLLLCCFYLAEKWQQGLFRKRIFLNYFLCFLFIIFVYFHTFYGVVDPNFNPQNKKEEKFLQYNYFMSGIAKFFQKNFNQIPADNTDRYYDYSSLVNEFPDFYQSSMKKDVPILSLGYSSAAIINFFSKPKIAAAAFSHVTFSAWDDSILGAAPNLFDYTYDFSTLKGKDIYFIVENNDMPLSEITQKIQPYADKVTLVKVFSSYRKGKFLRRYPLFYLTNFKHNEAKK